MASSMRDDAIQKLATKIKGIRIAMYTTVDQDGTLRSRPMATQDVEFDGDLWFFTRLDSPKVEDTNRVDKVNVAYASPSDDRFISVTGNASIVRDRAKIDQYWQPLLKAWFPNGKDDPALALIKVDVQDAEYWEGPKNAMVRIIGLAKAAITGDHSTLGKDEKIDLQ